MSGAFVDMALAVNAPIVPVRFAGALPPEALKKRLEYPLDLGRLDIWLGRPILPETLAAMPYKDRKDAVVAAINATGPSNAVEEPYPGDPQLEAAALSWAQQTGATPALAVVLKLLEANPSPTKEIARLIEGVRQGHLTVSDDPKDQWLAALVPPPKAHTVHYHGVLAPRAALRERIVPTPPPPPPEASRRLTPRPAAVPARWRSWAELLARVFLQQGWACPRCKQPMRFRAVVWPPAAGVVLEGLARSARGPPQSAVALP